MRGVKGTRIAKEVVCGSCGQQCLSDREGVRERKFCSIRCANMARQHLKRKTYQRSNLDLSPPIFHPKMTDIAWAAGLYEGEGTCHRHSGRKGGGLSLNVPQTDDWFVQRLRNLFGGTVVNYRVKRKNERWHGEYWRWVLNGPRAVGFMLTIFSFLSPWRKEQFMKAYFPTVSA